MGVSIRDIDNNNASFSEGTLTDVEVIDGTLELFKPEYYGAFDDTLDLLKRDDTTIAPESEAVATLRPDEGKFGGAVAVEEGTTNLYYDSGTTFSFTEDTSNYPIEPPVKPKNGGYWPDLSWHGDINVGTFNAGDSVTFSGYYMPYTDDKSIAISNKAGLQVYSSEGEEADIVFPDEWNKWYYFEYTFDITVDNTTNVRIEDNGYDYYEDTEAEHTTGYWCNVQIEEKPFATSFVDGSRADGKLRYRLNQMENFTFLVDVKFNGSDYAVSSGTFITLYQDNDNNISLKGTGSKNDTVKWAVKQNGKINTIQNFLSFNENNYNQLVVVKKESQISFYVNGKLDRDYTLNQLTNINEIRFEGKQSQLYDELLISPKAHSEQQIKDWYNQNLPLKRSAKGTRQSPQLDLSPVGTIESGTISWDSVPLNNYYVLSGGFSDSKVAIIKVGGADKAIGTRGINTVLVREGIFVEAKAFDTFKTENESDALENYINSLEEGDILIVSIEDEGARKLTQSCKDTIENKLYSERIQNLTYRESWLIFSRIGDKKYQEKWSGGEGQGDVEFYYYKPYIETSVDGGSTWQTATNGGAIPNLPANPTTLDVRQTLSTEDTTVTPILESLEVDIDTAEKNTDSGSFTATLEQEDFRVVEEDSTQLTSVEDHNDLLITPQQDTDSLDEVIDVHNNLYGNDSDSITSAEDEKTKITQATSDTITGTTDNSTMKVNQNDSGSFNIDAENWYTIVWQVFQEDSLTSNLEEYNHEGWVQDVKKEDDWIKPDRETSDWTKVERGGAEWHKG